MEEKYDDTFLARWLSNELSEEELETFKNSEDFNKFSAIISTLETAEYPDIDVSTNFQQTLQKIKDQNTTKTKVRKLNPYWISGVAACLLFAFSYLLFFQSITYTTQIAEQIDIKLPDNSKVILNADSKLSHKRFGWEKNRELELSGEAFFTVQKGEKFSVKTSQGIVSVLGTQFTVNSRNNFYNVICYEGKVKVKTPNSSDIILTKGEAFKLHNNKGETYSVKSEEPTWLQNQSSFYNTPILQVINELERQFPVVIIGKENIKPAFFTGRFSHENLESAIKTIFVSMNIPFSFEENKVKILKY